MSTKNTYIISYDVNNSEQFDYNELYQYIKSYGTWAKITESTWSVVTDKKATELRDELQNILPNKSRIFVIKSGVEAAWSNVICRNEWLKKNL